MPMPATSLRRFIPRVLLWLPVAFVVWYFTAPILLWPVAMLLRGIARVAASDLVRSIAQDGTTFVFLTKLRAGAGSMQGTVSVEVNGLLYSYGLPLFAALWVAADDGRRARTLYVAYVALVLAITWGVLADFLKNVAITSGTEITRQAGFSAPQREVIAFAYQLGSLILPTVVPAVLWVAMHRDFLDRLRMPASPEKRPPVPRG